ncbi:MAG: hypothetical protein KA123_01120 [Candidatus Eisenbacteria bacterium]|nr:hypothetical protein [Candidatus Eisenbacteria bacterium]
MSERTHGLRLARRMSNLRQAGWILALPIAIVFGCGGGGESGESGKQGKKSDVTPSVTEVSRPPSASAHGSKGNRPPEASFEVFPLTGYERLTAFRFNATLSKDDSTANELLLKRWDFDGDGAWDVNFQRASRMRHVFEKPGVFRPRLLVQDEGGLLDSIVGSEITIKAPCPAPEFELTDVNSHSRSFGKKIKLSDLRGHRVLVWFAMPSG